MISWERINELRDEVGEEDFGEVVEIFLEEVDEVIDRLRTAPNPAQFEEDLHFLKGCALNLGFDAFSKICHLGERNASAGNTAEIDIAAVISIYEKSKIEFVSQANVDRIGA